MTLDGKTAFRASLSAYQDQGSNEAIFCCMKEVVSGVCVLVAILVALTCVIQRRRKSKYSVLSQEVMDPNMMQMAVLHDSGGHHHPSPVHALVHKQDFLGLRKLLKELQRGSPPSDTDRNVSPASNMAQTTLMDDDDDDRMELMADSSPQGLADGLAASMSSAFDSGSQQSPQASTPVAAIPTANLINAQDVNGDTPLATAIMLGNLKIVK